MSATVLLGLGAPFIHASFDDHGWGVRAIGMGGAFTAVADDGSAPFWNPAGPGWLEKSEAAFMWQRAYPGLSDLHIVSGFASVVMPTRHGTFGGAFTTYNFGNLLQENIGLFHYSRKLGPFTSVGGNFRYLSHNYIIGTDPAYASNPVFVNGTKKTAITVDLGMMVRPSPFLSLGLSGTNLTEPNVGLVSKDRVPAEYKAGVAIHPVPNLTLAMDGAYLQQEGATRDNTSLLLGTEYWFWSRSNLSTAGRLGFSRNFGDNQKKAFKEITGGLSLLLGHESRFGVRLDYAFAVNINLAEGYSDTGKAGTHKVGVSLLWGGPEQKAPVSSIRKEEVAPVVQKPVVPQKKAAPVGVLPKVSIVLMDIGSKDVTPQEAAGIMEAVRKEFEKSKLFQIADKMQIQKVLAANPGLKNVPPQDRRLKIAQALKVRKMAVVSCSKNHGLYYINIDYVDTASGLPVLSEFSQVSSKAAFNGAAAEAAQKIIDGVLLQ